MSERDSTKSFSAGTVAVHGGEIEDQPFGAVVSPVFHTSTFSFESFAEMRSYARGELPGEYFYSRYGNPTVAGAHFRRRKTRVNSVLKENPRTRRSRINSSSTYLSRRTSERKRADARRKKSPLLRNKLAVSAKRLFG